MDIDQFRKLLIDSFESRSLEGGLSLVGAAMTDDYQARSKALLASEKYYSKQWFELEEDDLEKVPGILTFLDWIGYLYYLPAYMYHSFGSSFHEVNDEIVDVLLEDWTFRDRNDLTSVQREAFFRLTKDEVRAMSEYLEIVSKFVPWVDPEECDGIGNMFRSLLG